MYFGDNNKRYADCIERDSKMIADPYGEWEMTLVGYTKETFFLKKWLGFPKYTHFERRKGKFVIVGYSNENISPKDKK